ncbi:MAG: cell division protein FtsK [Propionibacterium sp.]|nr:cell division protein FtsK [Propionibacterium sp.]
MITLNRYEHVEESRPEKKTLMETFFWALGWMLSRIIWLIIASIRTFWSSLLYLTVAIILTVKFQYGWIPSLLLLIVPMIVPQTRAYSFLIRDWRAWMERRKAAKELTQGNALIRKMGLVTANDDTTYAIALETKTDESILHYAETIDGLPPERLVDACRSFQSELNAKRVRTIPMGSGKMEIHFIRKDPLDETLQIVEPSPLDLNTMSVDVGRDADGETFKVKLKNASGLLLGGLPGGGKTAAASSFVLPLALAKEDVDMMIIDGKGGADWSAYESLVSKFISESTSFESIRDELVNAVQEMNERIKSNADVLGHSNFWSVSPEKRREAGVKLKLIVIDECQALFDMTGINDKEEKALRNEIIRACTDLIKRGRSAGFFTIFITQKPTADSLPTAIRDNCALKISLRVSTPETEKAILGSSPDDAIDVPRATNIPLSRPGGAVAESENGERTEFRFYFFDENDIKNYLRQINYQPHNGM